MMSTLATSTGTGGRGPQDNTSDVEALERQIGATLEGLAGNFEAIATTVAATAGGEELNLAEISNRARLIQLLRATRENLAQVQADLDGRIQTACEVHERAIAGLRARLDSASLDPGRAWTPVSGFGASGGARTHKSREPAARPAGVWGQRSGAAPALRPQTSPASPAFINDKAAEAATGAAGAAEGGAARAVALRRAGRPATALGADVVGVQLADDIVLEARAISGVSDAEGVLRAIQTPDLYYVEEWGHLAWRVGEVLVHGNVGQVYAPGSKTPCERVKECHYGKDCGSLRGACACGYYHDPAAMAGSKDVRNFVASCSIYVPGAQHATKPTAMHFGSIEALQDDLHLISGNEARRYVDEAAHRLLCALVLIKYGAFWP